MFIVEDQLETINYYFEKMKDKSIGIREGYIGLFIYIPKIL